MKIIRRCFFVILLFSLLFFMGCSTTVPSNHAPIINSIPVTTSLVGASYAYDVEATDADDDTLTYSLTSSPTGMTIDSSSGVIGWTPSTAGDYNVILKVSDGESFDTQSFTITVTMTEITTLSPPTGVEASNNSFNKVLVTWNSVSGATHYKVYRANSLTGTKTAISGWQTGISYDDTSITPDQVYYYWVKAATSSSGDNASDYSDYDTGWAPAYELDAPSGVEASDIYFDRVEITWNSPSALATHYRVYRADSPTGTRMGISSWQTETSYNDKSATPGITYYYWVKAATTSSGGNASPYSIYDTGKRLGFSI